MIFEPSSIRSPSPSVQNTKNTKNAPKRARFSGAFFVSGTPHSTAHERHAHTGVSFVFVYFSPQKHEKHARLGEFLVFGALPLTRHVEQAIRACSTCLHLSSPSPFPRTPITRRFARYWCLTSSPFPIISRTPKTRPKRRVFVFAGSLSSPLSPLSPSSSLSPSLSLSPLSLPSPLSPLSPLSLSLLSSPSPSPLLLSFPLFFFLSLSPISYLSLSLLSLLPLPLLLSLSSLSPLLLPF